MTEEECTFILDKGSAEEYFNRGRLGINGFENLMRDLYKWPPEIISRQWISCHDGKAMFSHEKFHLCCSMQQRVYFEFYIRRRVLPLRVEEKDSGGQDAPSRSTTMTISTTHQKIPVFLRMHILSFLPIFEDDRNWLDDKWLRSFRVAVKGEEVDRGKQRRKKKCCCMCQPKWNNAEQRNTMHVSFSCCNDDSIQILWIYILCYYLSNLRWSICRCRCRCCCV